MSVCIGEDWSNRLTMGCADFLVGMWKRRFEKEDAKATKAEELTAKTQQEPKSDAVAVEVVERTAVRDQMEKAREELDAEIKARKEKIRARLEAFEA